MSDVDFGPLLLAILTFIGLAILLSRKKNSAAPQRRGRPSSTSPRFSPDQFASHWQRIEGIMAQPGMEQTKSAIFEADKLLDTALRQSGFRGETMGERLKNARQHFGNNAVYQGLWEAHKLRNALAHEVGFDVPKMVGQQHLNQFKAGLQYLRVLS
jgi:hypothetical protein